MEEKKVEVIEYEAAPCPVEGEVKTKTWIRRTVENVTEFVEDHAEGILLTAVTAPMVILYGQAIKYMYYLNKAAKKGQFF